MRYSVLIVLLIVSVAFSVLNATPVSVNFLLWQFETPLAVTVMSALGFGLLGGALLMLPWGMRSRRGMKRAQRSVTDLEKKLHATEAVKPVPQPRLPVTRHGAVDDGD